MDPARNALRDVEKHLEWSGDLHEQVAERGIARVPGDADLVERDERRPDRGHLRIAAARQRERHYKRQRYFRACHEWAHRLSRPWHLPQSSRRRSLSGGWRPRPSA